MKQLRLALVGSALFTLSFASVRSADAAGCSNCKDPDGGTIISPSAQANLQSTAYTMVIAAGVLAAADLVAITASSIQVGRGEQASMSWYKFAFSMGGASILSGIIGVTMGHYLNTLVPAVVPSTNAPALATAASVSTWMGVGVLAAGVANLGISVASYLQPMPEGHISMPVIAPTTLIDRSGAPAPGLAAAMRF